MELESADAIIKRVRRAFESFPQFGRDEKSLEGIILDFVEELKSFSAKIINDAFDEWRRIGNKMPLVSDILKICLKYREQENQYKRIDAVHEKRMALPAPKISSRDVSWMGKSWGEFTQEDKLGLKKHLLNMLSHKRKGYMQYLNSMCGVPMSFMKGEEKK